VTKKQQKTKKQKQKKNHKVKKTKTNFKNERERGGKSITKGVQLGC
jgi:hypothetical protein